MINRVLVYIVLFLFLISCTSNTILEQPDDLIPQDKMENILTDMFISASGEQIPNRFNERDSKCFNVICRKYHIDSAQFKKSNYYYTSQIDAYSTILKNVKKKLEYKRDSVQKIIKVNDSLRRTLNTKYDEISTNKRKLEAYKIILKTVDSLHKKRDSLTVLGVPFLTKTPKIIDKNRWYKWSSYKGVDTLKWQQKKVQKEGETEVLELVKKELSDREAIFEVEQSVKINKDSIRYVKRLLQLDTILYFPLVTIKEDDYSKRLKADKHNLILGQMNTSFINQIKFLKKDIKVKDSLYQKMEKEVGSAISTSNEVIKMVR